MCLAFQGETDGHWDLPVADRYPTTTTGQDENPQNLVLSRAQVASTDRQPPHAFSRRRENGIGKRRGSRGNTRLAAAALRLGAVHDVDFDIGRGIAHAQHLVVVEVALLPSPARPGDGT